MSNAKIALMISEANKLEVAERQADRDAMLKTMHEEVEQLHRRIRKLERTGGADK